MTGINPLPTEELRSNFRFEEMVVDNEIRYSPRSNNLIFGDNRHFSNYNIDTPLITRRIG